MSYTPLDPDRAEYLKQIERPRDAMIGALNSDCVHVPEEVREAAARQINDAYERVAHWVRFHHARKM